MIKHVTIRFPSDSSSNTDELQRLELALVFVTACKRCDHRTTICVTVFPRNRPRQRQPPCFDLSRALASDFSLSLTSPPAPDDKEKKQSHENERRVISKMTCVNTIGKFGRAITLLTFRFAAVGLARVGLCTGVFVLRAALAVVCRVTYARWTTFERRDENRFVR
jgi:hypothetical protein